MKLIVTEGLRMHDALGQATKDADLKASFFTIHHWPFVQPNPLSLPTSSTKVSSRATTKVVEKMVKERVKESLKQRPPFQRRWLRSSKDCSWLGAPQMVVIYVSHGTLTGSCNGSCGRVHQCRVKGCYGDHRAVDHRDPVKSA